jgi:hypothetical protein
MMNARTRFFIGRGQLPLYSVSTARRCCRQGLADCPCASLSQRGERACGTPGYGRP